jgi:hypothetical protein
MDGRFASKRSEAFHPRVCLSLLVFALLMVAAQSALAVAEDRPADRRAQETRLSFPGVDRFSDDEMRSLASIARIGDKPLYTMTRYGDYGLDELLRTGRGETAAYADHPLACSAFAVLRPDQDILFARNFDWAERVPLVIVRTDSPTGYPSFSVAFAHDIVAWLDNPTEENARAALDIPFLARDGFNACGVAVCGLSVAGEDVYDPAKISLGYQDMRRLILDRAATLDEALTLLRTYNNLGAYGHHVFIADAWGNSAIVEYFDGRVNVFPAVTSWQVVTNFMVAGADPDLLLDRCWRFRRLHEELRLRQGRADAPFALDLLSQVTQGRLGGGVMTEWSVVYDLTNGGITLSVGENYQQTWRYDLPMYEDLRITRVTASAKKLAPGERLTVTTTIVNDGPRPSRPATLEIYLSPRPAPVPGLDKPLRRLIVPALAPAADSIRTIRLSIPGETPLGAHHLIARIVNNPGTAGDLFPANNAHRMAGKVRIVKRD